MRRVGKIAGGGFVQRTGLQFERRDALDQVHRHRVDGQKSALEAIARGEMNATVECNPRFGPIAFDTLEKYRRKETIPPKIIVPDRFFDASNAAQFVNDAY